MFSLYTTKFRAAYIVVTLLAAISFGCAPSNAQQHEAAIKSVQVDTFKYFLTQYPDAVLIDVRTPGEIANGSIPKSIAWDYNDGTFDRNWNTLDSEKPVFIYCQSGGRSMKAAQHLQQNGFKQVYELKGGYRTWK